MTKGFNCNQVGLDENNVRGGFYDYVMHWAVVSELVDRIHLRISQISNRACRIDPHTEDRIKKGWVPNCVRR